MNITSEIKNELINDQKTDIKILKYYRFKWTGPMKKTCPNCGISWIITTLAGYRYSIKNNCVCKTCRETKIHKSQGHVIDGIYKRVCYICNKEKEYKSWASSKRNTPCHDCCIKMSKGISRKNKLPVLCRKCNKIRFYTTSINLKNKKENFSVCKSCVQKGRVGNRKGSIMPISTKILLSHKLSGKNHPQYGKPLSSTTKRKLRLLAIERLKQLHGVILPNYNPLACKYFDELVKENENNIQHAQNGGEYHIKELGYWVDGYDIKNNIVYEWYEKYHFNVDGNIKKKDLDRKDEIIKSLQCRFIGYDYFGNKIIDESPITQIKTTSG